MASRKQKAPKEAPGIVAALQYGHALQKEYAEPDQELPRLGWEPNPCHLCSPNFMAKVRGTGTIQTDTGVIKECPACTGAGRIHDLAGYGPQATALTQLAYEILFGGEKGGGKTAAMTVWMVSGNPHLPDYMKDGTPIPVNQSYVYHPSYRGLVLRRNVKDLRAWIGEASKVYAMLGGEFVDGEFRFPSGAIIWTGHLEDESSYEKYQGTPELHRVAIEEVCQIPSFELYMQVVSCIRSKTEGLRPQIFLTANPIGPGLGWVADRFVRVLDEKGKRVEPGTRIVEKVTNPITQEVGEIDRVFIRAGLRDNPFLLADKTYVYNLARLPEKLRKAYLEGDWDALSGQYFDQWRPSGPMVGEPENANHVIGPRNTNLRKHEKGLSVPEWERYPELREWWPRSIGGDIGYAHDSAFIFGARNPDNERIHVYKELVFQLTGYETIGVDLGRSVYPELVQLPSGTMTLWLARDAFQHRGDDQGIKSIVELLMRGLSQVLGEDAVHCPDIEIEKRREHEGMPRSGRPFDVDENFWKDFEKWEEEVRQRRRVGITILKCNSNRVLGWSYMRDALNWVPPAAPGGGKFDYDVYQKLFRDASVEKAVEYLQAAQPSHVEYPMLQVWEEACPKLISAIPSAVHDEKNPEDVDKTHFDGMDELDALRYMLLGLESGVGIEEPFAEWKAKTIRDWERRNPDAGAGDRRWLDYYIEDQEAEQYGGESFSLERSSRARGREARQAWRETLTGRVH